MEFDWVSAVGGVGLALLGIGLVLQFRSGSPRWVWRTVSIAGGVIALTGLAIDLSRQQGLSVFDPLVIAGLVAGIALPLLIGWILSRFVSK